MKILIAILVIIFLSGTLIHFLRMCKIVKYYQKENENLEKLNQRHKSFDYNLQQYVCDKTDFKTYYSALEVPNSEYKKWKSEIDLVTKRQLAIELAERIITDNNIFLEFEEDKLNNNVKITASIRVATVNNEQFLKGGDI